MKEIKAKEIKECSIAVPGSKSYTHRLLIAAALSNGKCIIGNCLKSEDTKLTMGALEKMGVRIEEDGNLTTVWGKGGRLSPCNDDIYLANSGTSMRLLTGIAALGDGPYILTGTKRMEERPIQDLLHGLHQIGISAKSVKGTGAPPVEVTGAPVRGGSLNLDCSISSQFLSSILLMAPCTREGIAVTVPRTIVSKPYVDMTVDIMNDTGIKVERDGYDSFFVPGGQVYQSGGYTVEPDCSQAGYFWAAAAITGKKIKVKNVSMGSRQGDVGFAKILESMGCELIEDSDGISIRGRALNGIEVDMSNMPDIVPTLAVVAAFAKGTTIIKNVAHLKEKECDRLGCVAAELSKMGVVVSTTDSGLVVEGGTPVGAVIDTYDDHRMAMCFAVAGLMAPGVVIKDEGCVKKSFPNYWEVFEGMYQ